MNLLPFFLILHAFILLGSSVPGPSISKNTNVHAPSVKSILTSSITLEGKDSTCTYSIREGKKVLLADINAFLSKKIPDAPVGMVQGVCFHPVDFQQIQQSSHVIFRLMEPNKEHPHFGDFYVLSLENKALLPLETFNQKFSNTFASIRMAPDGKRALLVEKSAPTRLQMLRFDTNEIRTIKELSQGESWDGSWFWSDVYMDALWESAQTVQIKVFKTPELEEDPVVLRSEGIEL